MASCGHARSRARAVPLSRLSGIFDAVDTAQASSAATRTDGILRPRAKPCPRRASLASMPAPREPPGSGGASPPSLPFVQFSPQKLDAVDLGVVFDGGELNGDLAAAVRRGGELLDDGFIGRASCGED